MLLSRQPRGCKASVLCTSLWTIFPNTLVSRCAAVDDLGCGKVDNRRNASPYPSRGPSAVHMQSELSTVQPVSLVIPATGVAFDRLLTRNWVLTVLRMTVCGWPCWCMNQLRAPVLDRDGPRYTYMNETRNETNRPPVA